MIKDEVSLAGPGRAADLSHLFPPLPSSNEQNVNKADVGVLVPQLRWDAAVKTKTQSALRGKYCPSLFPSGGP